MSPLICEDSSCRIVIDRDAHTIRFERCFTPQSLWWPKRVVPEFTCSLDDVLAVHRFRSDLDRADHSGAAIVTRHGRAMLSTAKNGFADVERFLNEECRDRGPGPWRQNPNMEMIAVVGMLLAAVVGVTVYVKWWAQ